MKCTIPEISWHNRDPVLSADVQPLTNEGFYRLATGGTDSHVLIWHLKILETGATITEPVSDLTRHQRAVNVVRWSHSGQYLASGDDDANIIIWHQKADDLVVMLDGDNDDKEKWNVFKVLRGHKEDVYDICWSPDSSKLISGSVDNTAIIWDLNKGLNDNILTDHKGFVQGVTWDPLGQYVATLSSDRICRVFTENGKQVKARLKKGQLPVQESHPLHGQVVRYFHDDTLKSFFRRLTFSPDGNLIITPAGCLELGPNNTKLYTSYLYTTNSLTQPAAILPSPGQYTIAARCCPILFQLRPDGPDPFISLPYRIVFAIASRSSVILYDTQQMSPFATISNIHYTRLTDVTWSHDGRLLAVSSTDGFCSLVTFEPNELGTEYVKEPEVMEQDTNETLNETAEEIMDTSLNVSIDERKEEKKEKKPSFLEKWTKRGEVEKGPEKPISRIEVRRKQKDTSNVTNEVKNEKPVSIIAVRRKPKIVDNKEKCDTNNEVSVIENKQEKSSENVESKSEKLENEITEVDDDVMIVETENEKENKNKENVLDKEKSTPKRGAKPGKKSAQNTTPAKPIAVRRKPREPPGGQMNITQFLKSPKPVTSKTKTNEKSEMNPYVLLEDCTKTNPQNSSIKASEVMIIDDDDDDSSSDLVSSPAKVLDFEDDSQSIKLVLEETVDEPIKTNEEKMEVNEDNTISSNCRNIESEEKVVKPPEKIVNGDSTENKKEETTSKDEGPVVNGDIKKTENCDKEESKPTPLSNVLSLLKDSPAKKRVPLITLSSPKHKKKPL